MEPVGLDDHARVLDQEHQHRDLEAEAPLPGGRRTVRRQVVAQIHDRCAGGNRSQEDQPASGRGLQTHPKRVVPEAQTCRSRWDRDLQERRVGRPDQRLVSLDSKVDLLANPQGCRVSSFKAPSKEERCAGGSSTSSERSAKRSSVPPSRLR